MTLKEVLRAEQVNHLDLSGFCQVDRDTPVREAVSLMRSKNVNVCLVTEGGQLTGILTDRDVLRRIAGVPESWDKPISALMTPNPVTISLETTAAEALWLMEEKRIRNLPAVDATGKIAGNMTHKTIIDYLAGRYPTEILNLPPRPDHFPDQVEGG